MALKKSIISRYGVPVEYWNISSIEFNKIEGVCVAKLNGYVNEEARRMENSEPLETTQIVICINEFEDIFGIEALSLENNNPYKAIYEYAKENREFFQDAEDIL